MKTEIKHSLADVGLLQEPAVVPGVTSAEYVAVLQEIAAGHSDRRRYKDHVAINVFAKWLEQENQRDRSLPMDETTLDELNADMTSGALRRSDRRKYGSLARQVPTVIRGLHNEAATANHPHLLRSMLNRRVYARLRRLASLTTPTQELLLNVERSGRRAPRRNGRHARPMTEASRRLVIDSTMTLLAKLNRQGVEQITRKEVNGLMDETANGNTYKTTARMLHCAAPAFRIGQELGMLDENVLDRVDNDTFKDQARRDFLPPDEIAKIQDITTLDMDDWQAVRDRLVALLLYDLALRKSELTGLTVDDVEMDGGRIDVRLRPEVQKGNKQLKRLRVLFPSTEQVLGHYLNRCRINFGGQSLIVDMNGQPASAAAIEGAVQRVAESDGLDLHCYRSDRRPTPHAFRRSFATINSQPLGLGMSVHELADRLRDSIRVVDESYRLHNPLIEAMRAEHYQQKLEPPEPQESVATALAILARTGAPPRVLASLRRWQASQDARDEVEDDVDPDTPDEQWVSEDDAMATVARHWTNIPSMRLLRDYFRSRGALRRSGRKGRTIYRERDVNRLLSDFVPVADHMSTDELHHRSVREILSAYAFMSIGAVKLIAVSELPGLSRSLATYRAGTWSRAETRKTGLPKLAKQGDFDGITGIDTETEISDIANV